MKRTILWFIILLVLQAGLGESKKDIYLMGLYPYTGGWTLPLAPTCSNMALDHINSREDLLPGYTLHVEWRNSDCSDTVALESFINSLTSNRTYIGVFGPGCSVPAVIIASISPAYSLITLSYSAASPSLEDTARFKYFIRGGLSDANIAVGRINFIDYYKWTRVAIISQQEEIFIYNSYLVEQALTDLNIDYRTASFDTKSLNVETQIKNAITLIDELGYRILFVNMYEDAAVLFICHLKIIVNPLPSLTWLIVGWYTSQWDANAYEITNGKCTTQDIRDVINGAIGILTNQIIPTILQSDKITISGFTPQELYDTYRQAALDENFNFETESNPFDAYLYDSLWTYALGLNQTLSDGYKPEDFNYTYLDFTEALYVNTYSQKFVGWTGNVSYFGRERREEKVLIMEFVDGNIEYRGYYTNFPANSSEFSNTTGVISNIGDFKIWNADRASDGIEDHFSSIIIFAAIVVTSILLAIYTTVLIVVILIGVMMKRPPATKSEPLINIVILASNYITVLIAVILTIDGKFFSSLSADSSTSIIYCHAQILLPTISSSILYGGVIAKASKYYIIVVENKFKYIGWLQARYLLLFPSALVLFDIAIVVSWAVIDPMLYQSEVVPSGLTDPPLYRTYRCVIPDNVTFLVPLAILNLLMVVVALFLAYHLRKVVNKSHRYSSAIVWVMYTSVVSTFIIILIRIFIVDVDIRNVLSAAITEILAFTLSSVIGLPIVYYLLKDPKGTTFFKSKSQECFPEDTQLLKRRISALERDLQVCSSTVIERELASLSNLRCDINDPDYTVNEKLRLSSIDEKD